MKMLGLRSVVKFGTSKYIISRITNKGITITDSKNNNTVYGLSDFLENLNLGVVKVEKI